MKYSTKLSPGTEERILAKESLRWCNHPEVENWLYYKLKFLIENLKLALKLALTRETILFTVYANTIFNYLLNLGYWVSQNALGKVFQTNMIVPGIKPVTSRITSVTLVYSLSHHGRRFWKLKGRYSLLFLESQINLPYSKQDLKTLFKS